LRELDVAGFSKMIAKSLGVRFQEPVARDDGTWSIGLWVRPGIGRQAAFLVMLPETERFLAVLHRLLPTIAGPFVIIAPTNRHRTVEVQEMLQRRGITFVAMEDHIFLNDSGELVAVESRDDAGQPQSTPKEDRRRIVKEFCERNNCKVKDIQEAAGVDESDYYKWLRGNVPDHYSTCVAVERVLRTGINAVHPPNRGSIHK
jgi:hypothetical protein